MHNLFLDVYQSAGIGSAQAEASRANEMAANLTDEVKRLSARVDRLSLLNAALWELIAPRLELTDVDLKAMALEMDARDGKIDSRLGATLRQCVNCQKNLMARQSRCQYCGTDHTPSTPFAGI